MFVQTGNGSQGSIITCADKWWNSGTQYSFVTQLVPMRSGIHSSFVTQLVPMRGGTHISFVMQLVQMRSKLHKMRVKLSTKFNFYTTCADRVKLAQMRSGTQYNILLCSLCKWAVEHSTGYNKGVEFRVQIIMFKSGKVNNYRVNQLCGPTVCIYFPYLISPILWNELPTWGVCPLVLQNAAPDHNRWHRSSYLYRSNWQRYSGWMCQTVHPLNST